MEITEGPSHLVTKTPDATWLRPRRPASNDEDMPHTVTPSSERRGVLFLVS